MQNIYKILFLIFCASVFPLKAQTIDPDSILYKKSWECGLRIRSDGFNLGAEITKSKNYKKSLLFQVQFSYFRHPKQLRQQSQYGGGGLFGSDGFRPFVYGKQNNLFTLYGGVGQKFLLAEKGKRHGVQLFFKYAAGLSIAILKPYMLEVIDTSSISGNTFSNTRILGYEPGNPNSLFLNKDYIAGGAGFGKGWKLSFLPALHTEVGMEFDWAKNESFIKALEIGVAADFYYKKVPMMVQDNKFLYPSVYAGFMLGKRIPQ